MADTTNDFNDAARVQHILVSAINQNNFEMVKSLLIQGELVPDAAALKAAIRSNSIHALQVLALLVQHGARPDAEALNMVINENRTASLTELLKAKNVPATSEMLRHAVACNYCTVAQLLVTEGQVTPTTEALKAALTSNALTKGTMSTTQVLALLVSHGASPDKEVLSIAVRDNRYASLKELLQAKNAPATLDMLRYAVSHGYYEFANLLVTAGKVVPDTQLLKDMLNPAKGFKSGNRLAFADLLLTHGAKPDLETVAFAVDAKWLPMVDMLVKHLPPGKKPPSPKP